MRNAGNEGAKRVNVAEDQYDERLASLRDDWLRLGSATEALQEQEHERAVWAVRSALEAAGIQTHSFLSIWVKSPMAGVLAAASVRSGLGDPLTAKLRAHLAGALEGAVPAAVRLRQDVDAVVWRARTAVHTRVAAELETRGPAWERWRDDMGNYAWDQVWQTIGDPVYSQGWEQAARESGGLFEQNLQPWADDMMEGQFGAGAMAQLDAMQLLEGVDVEPYEGVRRLAERCGWWWAFEQGVVICERPARFEVDGNRITVEYSDGWTVQV
jgi:hypothetical protein